MYHAPSNLAVPTQAGLPDSQVDLPWHGQEGGALRAKLQGEATLSSPPLSPLPPSAFPSSPPAKKSPERCGVPVTCSRLSWLQEVVILYRENSKGEQRGSDSGGPLAGRNIHVKRFAGVPLADVEIVLPGKVSLLPAHAPEAFPYALLIPGDGPLCTLRCSPETLPPVNRCCVLPADVLPPPSSRPRCQAPSG